jgi:squalene synthase HpnC
MSLTGDAPSKDESGENFPVASVLIAKANRPVVLAFYRVARMADDVADDPHADAAEKFARLAAIEASLTTADEGVPEAAALRRALADRGLTDRHMLDLLAAFRRDVTQTRYADWEDLMDYCRLSAAPVGRFMLDVHGESQATWPASDALCAALQVINHLQDCAKDYRQIDRVYVPADALAARGVAIIALGEARSSPALRAVIADLTCRTQELLAQSARLSRAVRDTRLALEIAVIQRLAESLCRRLLARDPLSQQVHHGKAEALAVALLGVGRFAVGRLGVSKRAEVGHKGAEQPPLRP